MFPTCRMRPTAGTSFIPSDSGLAWSGSRWEPTIEGITTAGVQVRNFELQSQDSRQSSRPAPSYFSTLVAAIADAVSDAQEDRGAN